MVRSTTGPSGLISPADGLRCDIVNYLRDAIVRRIGGER
jgi:hypothetical protein